MNFAGLACRWPSLSAYLCVLCVSVVNAPAQTAIHLDQIGYPADAPKIAAVIGTANEFTVNRAGDGVEVYKGALGQPSFDRDSGDRVRIADFSSMTAPGRYELRMKDARSAPFDIAADPYRDLLRLSIRSYYGQRCGTAVDLGGGYAHPACHLEEAYHSSSGRSGTRPQSRGWHDAGDYGRYSVNSGITVGTLLWAWEMFPDELAKLDLAIPESGNATPDFLDEVRWNLDWMLSMQDSDGGVWQKQTSRMFPRFVSPQDDHLTSYIIGTGSEPYKSTCATADFAAVMAIAARIYTPFDKPFADRALGASKRAWAWVTVHPNVAFRNPHLVWTGEYGDNDCSDERLWAAAELWRTASLPQAGAYFRAHAAEATAAIRPDSPPSWRSVGALGAWTYALASNADPSIAAAIRRKSIEAADAIVIRSIRHPYRIPMLRADYVWGSNAVAANYGLQLLVANEMQPQRKYADASLEMVHYLLGRNPLSLSYVTGVGSKQVMHPHHRPSGADSIAAPWPGLLAGGPNADRQDRVVQRLPPNIPPERAYVDDQESYSTNEVAINWNAPLVFVAAGLRHAAP